MFEFISAEIIREDEMDKEGRKEGTGSTLNSRTHIPQTRIVSQGRGQDP